ncbi:exo-beta-N-acetylmuramidase NamZ domain-containing protein [Xanthomarina gelatinilytica]|uniref:exo-beta-N-acetylmuramidase NamZ family protein n=1 Tax=Xanthomarina gelatinilytica TaxID=1137281 RepID=UPI003AA80F56
MMQLKFILLKNTVLLFVFILISCGNFSSAKNEKSPTKIDKEIASSQVNSNDSQIVVGANQTEKYMPLIQGKRIGVVANLTSVIFKNEAQTTYTHLVDSLLALQMDLRKVFSPEHGFRGNVDAGEFVESGKDTKTGLPIVSLYGKNKKATKESLKDIDIMIFDIQDVGVRFYTYISTLHYMMESCAEANIPLLILDRPNPNGHYVDGPTLEPENKSFLGMHPIPLVHGLTIGEFAQMLNGEKWLENQAQCNITVIPAKNYTHNKFYQVPIRPSPNLPNDQAIKLYPSLGLFEGTNINAGRGTEFQFQRYGAPFLDKNVFLFTYTPKESFGAKNPKHKDVLCYGEDLKNDSLYAEVSLKWLIKAYNHATDKSKVFNTENFTKHAGTDKLQKQIEAGLSEADIKATWQKDLEAFKKLRAKYLIYN